MQFRLADAMKKALFILLLVGALAKATLLTSGCASIIPPSGGPRDSLPPVLVMARPPDLSRNFSSQKIVFTFDEYIQLKDVNSSLIVSPVPKTLPEVESKLKTLTVTLKDTLRPFTTYVLDFGKAIRDINEGNILKNFRYVFSTGPYIDSMELSGTVIMASTGKPDSTLMALLYKHLDDSAVYNERPRYVARLDSSGHFLFRNITPGSYAIYALKDESGTYRYTSKTMPFAFLDSPILVLSRNAPVSLYAYSDTAGSAPVRKSSTTPAPAKRKKEDETNKRLSFSVNISSGQFGLLDTMLFQFPVPLKSFDTSQIQLVDDQFQKVRNAHFLEDSTKKKVWLYNSWTADTRYHIVAAKEFAEDTSGRRLLKPDTLTFHTKRESEYGSLLLHFRNMDLSLNPVLLFVQKDVIKKTHIVRGKEVKYRLFEPGQYELRVLYDRNKNGVWDPGDFWTHKQPELVKPVSHKPINIKANWDNEYDISL